MKRIVEGNTLSFWEGERQILSIEEAQNENNITISLSGELRSDLVHDFQDELIAIVTVGADMILDFTGLTYLSSAAQQALLNVQQKIDELGKGTLTLYRIPLAIMEELEKTGTSELLAIEQ